MHRRKYPWGCRDCLGHELGYSSQGYPICNECSSENVVVEGTEPVYQIPVGSFSDGMVTSDLGWAGMHLFESLGIAPTIGLSGFSSPQHFKQWAVSVLSNKLGDLGTLEEWDSIAIDLCECWMPSLSEQFPAHTESSCSNQFSYLVWRQEPDPDAIKTTMKNVFALKQKKQNLAGPSEKSPAVSLKLFTFTTSLLESLKSKGIVPNCEAHDDADGLDGEDIVWINLSDDGGPLMGEYLSVSRAHQESDDWIVGHSDRNCYGGDPQHWCEIGSHAELMGKLLQWFIERHEQLNAH